MTQGQQGQSAVTLKRNGLTVECFFSENGRLSQKVERHDRQITKYAYQHDDKGHLTQVRRNGIVTESYMYNLFGQRITQWRAYHGFSDNYSDLLFYDDGGRLYRAGGTLFSYDKRGALAQRRDRQGATYYFYGTDTMLDRVILPSRTEIRYEYYKSIPTCPARRYRNGDLSAELFWFDPLHLAAYRDHDNLLEYVFVYDDAGILNRVRIDRFEAENHNSGANTHCGIPTSDWLGLFAAQRRREMLHDFLSMYSLPLELLCGCDQVGTLRTLTDKSGRLVKNIVRDSFGVQQTDSFPALFMPVGFAGGLTDPETGLVRFGYRDYDPAIGRFTAPDPLGDTGGDHDLYDYCIDDPVTMNDPSGLFPPLLLYLGGKALALGIAAAGAYGSAWGADKIKSSRDGNKSSDAVDGMNRIAPKVVAASAASALPGVAVMGPGAATAAAQRVGAAIQSSAHGDKIMKGAQIAEAFFNPNAPTTPSGAALIGTGASRLVDELRQMREQRKE